MNQTPKVFGFWSGGDSIAELARALDKNRPTTSEGPYRISVFAETADELARRMDIAAGKLARGIIPDEEGIFLGEQPIEGKVAAVFSGVATAYPGLGNALFSLLPEYKRLQIDDEPQLKDIYLQITDPRISAFQKGFLKPLAGVMTSASYFSILKDVLDVRVDAVMGVSLGESSMLFATNAYPDIHAHYTRFIESGLFDKLAFYSDSPFVSTQQRDPRQRFENWNIMGNTDRIEEVVAAAAVSEDIEVTVSASPNNCLVGGSATGCRRLTEAFPDLRCRNVDFDCAVHTRHARMAEAELRYVLDIPCSNSVDVDVYSLIAERRVDPVADRVEKYILQQMIQPIDAQSHFERSWNGGVRTFVEVGYHSWLARCIRDTLGDRPHLAVATNIRGVEPVYRLALAMGELYAHVIDSRLDVLARHSGTDDRAFDD